MDDNDNHKLPHHLCQTIGSMLDPDFVVTREMLNPVFEADPDLDLDLDFDHMTQSEKKSLSNRRYREKQRKLAAAGHPDTLLMLNKRREARAKRNAMIKEMESKLVGAELEEIERKAEARRKRRKELAMETKEKANAGDLVAIAKLQRLKDNNRRNVLKYQQEDKNNPHQRIMEDDEDDDDDEEEEDEDEEEEE